MAITIDQFGKALVASGLLTAEEVKTLWNAIPVAERPKDGDGFAQMLIKQERLSEFQAKELLSGSGTPLVLNQYVLLSKIGAGGMGQVFNAQHRKMKRLAAIKLLPSALTKVESSLSGAARHNIWDISARVLATPRMGVGKMPVLEPCMRRRSTSSLNSRSWRRTAPGFRLGRELAAVMRLRCCGSVPVDRILRNDAFF